MDERSVIIFAFIVGYFVLCIVIGLWAMRRTQTAADFFMAGRNLGFIVTSVAVFSSVMSGFGFVGGPGLVYRMGVSSCWIVISAAFGQAISFFLLGKKLRLIAAERDSISLPDVVMARYNSRPAGFLTAIAILLGVMGYLATQIAAMSTVLQSLLAELMEWNIDLFSCAVFSTALLVFYCVTGGIIASVYTDLIQGFVMMIASVLVVMAAVNVVDGGLAGMSKTIGQDDPAAMSPWGTLGMFGCLSWYFVFALGVSGQPHVITKLMMTRRVEDARYMYPITLLGYSLSALLWIVLGLAMRALVIQGHHPELTSPDQAAPAFLQQYANPYLAGIVFAGLFAAIMSTADAFLNIGVAAVVHDIPSAFGIRVTKELLWARITTVIIASLATAFAFYSTELVAILGAFGWGTFAAALVPTVAIGFNWKRANGLAACVAVTVSLLLNFGIKFYNVQLPLSIDAGAFSLLVSLALFIAVSLLTGRDDGDFLGIAQK